MFELISGVKQECILSRFLFLITIDFVMRKIMNNCSYDIKQANNRMTDLDLADDLALLSDNKNSLQTMTKNLNRFGARVGLRLMQRRPKPCQLGERMSTPLLLVNKPLNMQRNSSIWADAFQTKDRSKVKSRLGKASAVFQRLRKIWRAKSISKSIKMELYSAIAVSTAIYACET